MLGSITVLLLYQTIGEILVLVLGVPIPGPVVGMALLFVTLLVRGEAPAPLRETAERLLSHLSLLFVPAGVGVMLHFERLGAEWPAIVLALVASTVLTLGVSALVMQALRRRSGSGARDG